MIAAQLFDQTVTLLTAIAPGGGTATATYAMPTNYVAWIEATAILTFASGGNVAGGAALKASGVYENRNGASLTVPGAITGSNNPAASNTATFSSAFAEASDINSGLGVQPTMGLSVSSGNSVVATVQNNFTSAVDAMVHFRVIGAKGA